MPKAEISWKRTAPDGVKLQIYVRHTGGQYRFFVRERRYERWELMAQPQLEDWLALLDAVQRRVQRRLLKPEEAERVKRIIRERFPGESGQCQRPPGR